MQCSFLALTFRGERFRGGQLPLGELVRLGAWDRALRSIARDRFIAEHADRQRVRAGFEASFQLCLTSIGEGSAVLDVVRVGDDLEGEDEFDEAVAVVDDMVTAMRENRVPPPEISVESYRFLEAALAPLADGEILLFADARHRGALEPDHAQRFGSSCPPGQADARNSASGLRRDGVSVSAQLGEQHIRNQPSRTGRKIELPIQAPIRVPVHRASDPDANVLLWVGGEADFVPGEAPKNFSFTRGAIVSGPPIHSRFEELKSIPNGWLHEESKAPSKARLERAERLVWAIVDRGPFDRPFIYPTEDGGVQLEWDIPGGRAELTFSENLEQVAGCATWQDGDFSELSVTLPPQPNHSRLDSVTGAALDTMASWLKALPGCST